MQNNISPHKKAAGKLMIEAIGVEKTFNDNFKINVLSNLNVEIPKGEMLAIVGVSGTGKSTLLHIFGTLDTPTKGKLLFDGEDVFAKNNKELAAFRNRKVGFIFQAHHLLPEFTSLENVIMPGLIGGINREEIMENGNKLLAKVGLSSRLEHKVGELSGGEQQRVAIARALVMNPSVLLADEPTGNLDPATGQKVFELLSELNETFGLTTVMVTHNYELASRMDRCLTLKGGQLQ